ncbi:hypothetical protein [Streptomyces sp. ICN441]|uniref:hypothetical protein n=1 Tax=Streptomyces sp. ICN441 TaxID=2558286 RepID=UPI00141BBA27|nr:hypothetical protein [Streptomyces sp. ICN441]
MLEALGEAGGLYTARAVELSTEDVIVCAREAGHYAPEDKPSFEDGEPGGWHFAGASIWRDSGAAATRTRSSEKSERIGIGRA